MSLYIKPEKSCLERKRSRRSRDPGSHGDFPRSRITYRKPLPLARRRKPLARSARLCMHPKKTTSTTPITRRPAAYILQVV